MRVWLALVLLAQAPRVALAQQGPGPMAPEAKQHLERGLRYYNSQDYVHAIEEFKAGYRIDPRPELLYALGQAQRLSGDCKKAIQSYEAFLRTSPTELQAASARQNLERCEVELKAKARPAPPPAPPPRSPPRSPPPAETTAPPASTPILTRELPPAREPEPWYKDTLGDVLTGAGAVAVVVGAIVWKMGHDDIDDANAAAAAGTDYGRFTQLADGAETRQTVGGAMFLTGVALVGGGLVRYLLRPGASEPALAAVPAPGGGLLSLRRRF